MKNGLKKIGKALSALFLLATVAWAATVRWVMTTWAHLSMEELVYQLNAPIEGTNSELIMQGVLQIGLPLLAGLVLLIVLLWKVRSKKLWWGLVLLAAFLDVAIGAFAWNRLDVTTYLQNQGEDSTFIEDHYVDPAGVELQFPEKKRNLVYIYLESMETTYADDASGGGFGDTDVIPELTALALENESFSGDSSRINGGYVMPGATWTMGALFAQTSGLPLKSSITDVSNGGMATQKSFFPGITCLGDILDAAGYKQVFMIGSEGDFAGRSLYFTEHGNYEIQDYNYAKEHGQIPQDYKVWWGYEDEKLFANARAELEQLSQGEEPFNLTLLTVDTHFEDGYVCDLCGDTFGDNQYANVMACSSKQVAEFVQWIQQQDFYADTTIVISGDHLTMDSDFCQDVSADYDRRTYMAYINAAAEKSVQETRAFTTFDNFPTTLAALGVSIPGGRLGLGTDLFSDTQTLAEEYGTTALAAEIARKSTFVENLSGVDTRTFAVVNQLENYEDGTVKMEPADARHAEIIIGGIAELEKPVRRVWVELTDENGGNLQTVDAELRADRCYHAQLDLTAYDRGYGHLEVQVQPRRGKAFARLSYTGQLLLIGDFQQYLDNLSLLKDDGYAYFFAVKDEGTNALTEEMQTSLHALGFTADLTDQFRSGYLAIYDGQTYNEQLAYERLEASGTMPDGTPYTAVSAGRDQGSEASIQIDGIEYTNDGRGMNVVVYDTVKNVVVSCGHFDTYQQPPTVEFEPLGGSKYLVRVDPHGHEWWQFGRPKLYLWNAENSTKAKVCALEPAEDGLYTGIVNLSGMDTQNFDMSIYLYYYENMLRCQLHTHTVLD